MSDAAAVPSNIHPSLKDEEYGSRGYMAKDPEGHHWHFGTHRPGDYREGGPKNGTAWNSDASERGIS